MTMAHDLIIDRFSPMVDREKPLATWYAQGHSDGLGDRLLMFDNTSAPSWEILRFRPGIAGNDRFEAALRERVDQLASFHHPAFPKVRRIKELGHEDDLAVVSTYTAGVRLAEALEKPWNAAFAMRVIRQLTPALAALQEHGTGIAHGALNVDRVIMTPQGQLIIREHMVGTALASLDLSAARLWADFRVLAAPTHTMPPSLDRRSDVVQLGLLVLSLMTGRRIGPDEYPRKAAALLDALEQRHGGQAAALFRSLRSWLERALQLDDDLFESARDADEALAEYRDQLDPPDDPFSGHPTRFGKGPDESGDWRQGRRGPQGIAPRRVDVPTEETPLPSPVLAANVRLADEARGQAVPLSLTQRPVFRWVAVVVASLAIGEAVFIGRLLYARATTPVFPVAAVVDSPRPSGVAQPGGVARLDSTSIPVLPAAIATEADRKGPEIRPSTSQPGASPAENRAAGAQALTGSQRSGGFRLSSTVEVHVLDGERVLGSSEEGPIMAPAGRHEFDFINSTIGYRERRTVDIVPGEITSLRITVPNGTLNINAVPWAMVWIDGTSFGETPLGNLSIAPGEHEIVFRHPQLGERREKTFVRANSSTRMAVNLQRKD